MRRSEKAITEPGELAAIIRKARVCRLAMCDDDNPYMVPLSFGYDGDAIYFHSACEGKKIEILERNNRVCFEFEAGVEVIENETLPCKWSCAFQSVIGFGRAVELRSQEEKIKGLELIMAQYSEQNWDFSKIPLAALSVWAIRIDSMSGKQSPAPAAAN